MSPLCSTNFISICNLQTKCTVSVVFHWCTYILFCLIVHVLAFADHMTLNIVCTTLCLINFILISMISAEINVMVKLFMYLMYYECCHQILVICYWINFVVTNFTVEVLGYNWNHFSVFVVLILASFWFLIICNICLLHVHSFPSLDSKAKTEEWKSHSKGPYCTGKSKIRQTILEKWMKINGFSNEWPHHMVQFYNIASL